MVYPKRVIVGENATDALIFKPISNGMLDFFKNQYTNAVNAMSGISSDFVNTCTTIYNNYNSERALNEARAVIHMSEGHLRQDVIYPVPLGGFGNVNLVMQSYIMACPDIRSEVDRDLLYGFKDTYIEEEKVDVRYSDKYIDVVNHIGQYTEDGDGYYSHYYSGESDLCYMDKLAILKTWDNAKIRMADGFDPTDLEDN